jgi:R3H domain
MHWTCYCHGPSYRTHPELIAAWIDAVPPIPPSVSTVFLDVTPAPGWMRAQRPDWIPNFVQDRRVAKKFITEHRDPIIALIQVLTARGLEVQLTGLLSAKSATFLVDMVDEGEKRELDVVFTGRLVPVEIQRRAPWLYTVVRSLAPVRYGWLDAQQAETSIADGEGSFGRLPPRNQFEYCAARLETTKWGKDTESLWGKEAQADKQWAVGVLRRFVEFMRDEGDVEKVFEPVDSRKRALMHHLAEDLGFKTESLGEGEGRYVRVYRERGGGDGEKGVEVELGRLKDLTI